MKQSGVPTLFTLKYVLLENRNIEVYEDGERKEDAKWEMVGKEIHAERGGGNVGILRIEANGDLKLIASIVEGERLDLPKEGQRILRKLK